VQCADVELTVPEEHVLPQLEEEMDWEMLEGRRNGSRSSECEGSA
jgi:hypothetical protein